MNFLANDRASMNPSATSMISQISSKSGTTIAQGLNGETETEGQDGFPTTVEGAFGRQATLAEITDRGIYEYKYLALTKSFI